MHQPSSPSRGGIALTHGAGGNCNAPLLRVVADTFCKHGWTVLRYNLPFRRNRRTGPPLRYSATADQSGIRDATRELRKHTGGVIVAGGHSYGGRQTTMLSAKEPGACDALLALSYPLHPPKKPDQLRTEHFPELRVPVLFVHGSADPFGTVAEMQTAIEPIPAKKKLAIIDAAGHDLKSGKFDVEALIVRELDILLNG